MKAETKWAVIASVLVFLWLVVQMLLGLQTAENLEKFGWLSMVVSLLIFVAVYYMVTREKRERELGGHMSWKQGFWSASIMTLIFIPISTLLLYLFFTSINPELVILAADGNMEIEPVNAALMTHVVFAIFGGLLFSLLFPLLTRRTAHT